MIPGDRTIDRIAPTRVQVLRRCPRQFQLTYGDGNRDSCGGVRPTSAVATLGTLSHECIAVLLRGRVANAGDWPPSSDAIAAAWAEAVHKVEASTGRGEVIGLPRFAITQARTVGLARRVCEMVAGVRPDEMFPEESLGRDSLLHGVADLVVRSRPNAHWIMDYKSGTVHEGDPTIPRGDYRSQLELYAYLEWRETGSWPTHLYLAPLVGPVIAWAVDPGRCEQEASAAAALVETYNSRLPGTQPTLPSIESCRFCLHQVDCDEFWSAVDPRWNEAFTSIEGEIDEVQPTALAGVIVRLSVQRGTLPVAKAEVEGVPLSMFEELSVGATVRITGLYADRNAGRFRLGDQGRIREVPNRGSS